MRRELRLPSPQRLLHIARSVAHAVSRVLAAHGTTGLTLTLVCLSVALLNGFPLYFPDSGGYAGRIAYVHAFRSPVPGLLAAPWYGVLGVWALPVINSAAVALMLVRNATVLGLPMPIGRTAALLVISGVPFFTSLIMPDVWIVVMALAILVLMHRWHAVDALIAATAAAGHGSHAAILLLVLPVAVLACPAPRRAVAALGGTLVLSVVILAASNRVVTHRWFPNSYAWSITASKMLNDVPETADDLCRRQSDHPLCHKRDLIVRNPDGDIDDSYYLWVDRIGDERRGGLTRAQMNDAGRRLFFGAVRDHPLTLARATLADWASAYRPSQGLGFTGFMVKDSTNAFNYFIIDRDRGRFVPRGWLTHPVFQYALFGATLALSIGALALTIAGWRRRVRETNAAIVVLWTMWVVNDLVFSLLSGMWGRYHLRALGLMVPIVLLARWQAPADTRPA